MMKKLLLLTVVMGSYQSVGMEGNKKPGPQEKELKIERSHSHQKSNERISDKGNFGNYAAEKKYFANNRPSA
jgi:hypothetical protein